MWGPVRIIALVKEHILFLNKAKMVMKRQKICKRSCDIDLCFLAFTLIWIMWGPKRNVCPKLVRNLLNVPPSRRARLENFQITLKRGAVTQFSDDLPRLPFKPVYFPKVGLDLCQQKENVYEHDVWSSGNKESSGGSFKKQQKTHSHSHFNWWLKYKFGGFQWVTQGIYIHV